MSDLPNNWISTKLGEVVKYKKGKKPSTLSETEFDGAIPYLDIKALEKGIVRNFADVSSSNILDESSIAIVWDGARSGWVQKGVYGALGSTIASLTPVGVNVDYLFHFLKSQFEFLNTNTRGSGIPHVDPNVLWDLDFPLAPLKEQKRIVAKLDKLFANIDQIEKRYERIKTITSEFVEACLGAAYNSRSNLHSFLEEGTKRIGNGWAGVRKVGVSAKEGIIELDTGQKESFEKYKVVQPGDFVYNAMRINIGSIARYEGSEIAITSPDYIVFRVKEFLSPSLLFFYLRSEGGLREIGSNTKGSVRSRLYFSSLVNINYPIASEKIQRLAEEFLGWVMSFTKRWETSLQPKLDDLRRNILTKAFRGELVEQYPSDGSGAELLEKIKDGSEFENVVREIEAAEIFEEMLEDIKSEIMEIFEVIEDAKRRLTPKEVWQKSKFKDDIDAFYASLKEEIETKKRVKESADKKYLELV